MLSTNTKISSMLSSRQSEAPRNLAQGRRGMSVGCDEENFSFPEESLFTRALCEISRFARNDTRRFGQLLYYLHYLFLQPFQGLLSSLYLSLPTFNTAVVRFSC